MGNFAISDFGRFFYMFIKRNPKQSSVIKRFVVGIPIYFIPEYYNAQTNRSLPFRGIRQDVVSEIELYSM